MSSITDRNPPRINGSNKRKVFAIFENKSNGASVESKRRKNGEPLKIVSWNVAGLRACVKKGGHTAVAKFDADIILLQETKCSEFPPEFATLDNYPFKKLCVSKEKNGGYAGVAMLSREKPIMVTCGVNDEILDNHARLIQAEFENFFVLCVYVLNSGQKLVNLEKRSRWESLIRDKISKLDVLKPVMYIGDMNVAHEEIDLKNPVSNRNKTAGFTDQERGDFTKLLSLGFVDVFRKRNPELKDAYTFWSYLGNARGKNVGWRIDYFVVSERIYEKIRECEIHADVMGSDHCPISMVIDI